MAPTITAAIFGIWRGSSCMGENSCVVQVVVAGRLPGPALLDSPAGKMQEERRERRGEMNAAAERTSRSRL